MPRVGNARARGVVTLLGSHYSACHVAALQANLARRRPDKD